MSDRDGKLNRFIQYSSEVLNNTKEEQNRTEYVMEEKERNAEVTSTKKEVESCIQQKRNNKIAEEQH